MMMTTVISMVWLTVSAEATANTPELKLWNHLMSTTGYNRNLRPILDDPNKQIDVKFLFSLGRLESLNEKSQIMTTFGWMSVYWTDELLTWDPADYGGLYRLVVPGELIWLPEIAMMNSVEQGNDLSMTSKFRASILHDGVVVWAPGFKWQTSCTVDLVTFPYDSQECNVTFVNWVYQATQVNFSLQSDTMDLSQFEPNGEWAVVSAKIIKEQVAPSPDHDIFLPIVKFTLFLKRKPEFYVLNVLIPSIIMTLISALVFCLPAESGEKIGLGITVLLSYSVVLLMVSDITPRTSSMPLITVYIVTNMGLTALSLIGTVIILNVFHHNPERPVPAWTRTVFLKHFACCVGLGTENDHGLHVVYPDIGKGGNSNDLKIEDINGYKVKEDLQLRPEVRLPENLLIFLKSAREKEAESAVIDKNRADWQLLAAVLDRIFFIIFGIILILSGVIIMGVMSKDSSK